MKAVVVEIKGKDAIVLNKNGEFVKIRNDGTFKIGYEVDMPQAKVFNLNRFMKAASVAAAFLLVSGISFGAYSYTRPYSYIDVDINPSVEFTANRFDRIIDAKALNDDGKKLLEQESYKNKDIQKGIHSILQSAAQEGFIKEDSREAVMVTVSGTDEKKVEKLEQEVKAAVEKSLGEEEAKAKVMVEKTSLERRDDAQKMGISPGKLNLIEKAIEDNPQLKVEDLKNAPVRDIMKQINASRKNNKQEKQTEKNDTKAAQTTVKEGAAQSGKAGQDQLQNKDADKKDDKDNEKKDGQGKSKTTVKPTSKPTPKPTPKPTVKPRGNSKTEDKDKNSSKKNRDQENDDDEDDGDSQEDDGKDKNKEADRKDKK